MLDCDEDKGEQENVAPLKAWEGKDIQRVMFLTFEDTDYILRQAEKHQVYKYKRPYSQEEYDDEIFKQRKYLDPRIIEQEKKAPFHLKELKMYETGVPEEILTESERIQILEVILDDSKIFLTQTFPSNHE